MSPLDFDRKKNNRKNKFGCRVCGGATEVYINARAQRSSDRATIGTASSSYCRIHAEVAMESIEKTLGPSKNV